MTKDTRKRFDWAIQTLKNLTGHLNGDDIDKVAIQLKTTLYDDSIFGVPCSEDIGEKIKLSYENDCGRFRFVFYNHPTDGSTPYRLWWDDCEAEDKLIAFSAFPGLIQKIITGVEQNHDFEAEIAASDAIRIIKELLDKIAQRSSNQAD